MDIEGKIRDFSESKTYQQTFTPILNGETVPADYRPGQQISPLEAQKIAEEFFKKMGYSGKVTRGGGGGESGPGYRIEHWGYRIETGDKGENSRNSEIEVSIETSTGNIVGFRNWDHNDPVKPMTKPLIIKRPKPLRNVL